MCLSWGRGSKVWAKAQECNFNRIPFTLEGNIENSEEVFFVLLTQGFYTRIVTFPKEIFVVTMIAEYLWCLVIGSGMCTEKSLIIQN